MPNFTRTIEDFACERCGYQVSGDGYTNHCPKCLWSKHVDIDPGDRGNPCRGMMEPVKLEIKNSGYILIHKCQVCGSVKRNKTAKSDDRDALIGLAGRT